MWNCWPVSQSACKWPLLGNDLQSLITWLISCYSLSADCCQCANLMITITDIGRPQMLMCLNPWLPLRSAPGPSSNVVFGENEAMSGDWLWSDLCWSSGHNWEIETSASGASCVIGMRRWIGEISSCHTRVMTTLLFKMESNDCSPQHETFLVLTSWHTIFCIDVCTTTCCQWLMTQKESDPETLLSPGYKRDTGLGVIQWPSDTRSHEAEISVNILSK